MDNQAARMVKYARHTYYDHMNVTYGCDWSFPNENSTVYKVCDNAAAIANYGKNSYKLYGFYQDGTIMNFANWGLHQVRGIGGATYLEYKVSTTRLPMTKK